MSVRSSGHFPQDRTASPLGCAACSARKKSIIYCGPTYPDWGPPYPPYVFFCAEVRSERYRSEGYTNYFAVVDMCQIAGDPYFLDLVSGTVFIWRLTFREWLLSHCFVDVSMSPRFLLVGSYSIAISISLYATHRVHHAGIPRPAWHILFEPFSSRKLHQ